MQVGPDLALQRVQHSGQHQQEQHHLDAEALARFHGRFGGPGEEGDDVADFLVQRRLGAVGIIHRLVVQRRRHGDLVAGEIGVVVHAVQYRFPIRRFVLIAGQKGMYVVGAAFSGLGHQRQIRRQGAVVGGAGRVRVGVGRDEAVGRLGRAFEHIAFVIGTGGDFVFGGDGLDLFCREADFLQVSVGNKIQAMAVGADFPVDLEAAPERRPVESAEDAVE